MKMKLGARRQVVEGIILNIFLPVVFLHATFYPERKIYRHQYFFLCRPKKKLGQFSVVKITGREKAAVFHTSVVVLILPTLWLLFREKKKKTSWKKSTLLGFQSYSAFLHCCFYFLLEQIA